MYDRWQKYHSPRRPDDEKGFTLIELLIVIIILGVLAAIVVFAVTGITSNGTKEACSSTVKTVNTAAEAYYAQNNTGATTLNALQTGGFLHDAPATATTYTGGSGSNTWTVTFNPVGSSTSAGNATGSYKTGSTTGTC